MATPQLPIAKKLKIKSGRDPLVNDDPILSDKDYIDYLKEYLEDNLRRFSNLTEKLTARNETIAQLESKVKEMSMNPYNSRAYQIYKEILNGAAATGSLSPEAIAAAAKQRNVAPEALLQVLLTHYAGVSEYAAKQATARF